MSLICQRRPFLPPRAIEFVIGSVGAALLLCAILGQQSWLDKHFLPAFFLSRRPYVLLEDLGRLVVAGIGIVIALLARRRIRDFIAYTPVRALSMTLSVALAFGASELVLRKIHLRAAAEEPPNIEPQRRHDPRLGWAFVPSRTGRHIIGGRAVEYTFDAAGYRVRSDDEPVDPQRPTIIFTGESMMVGEGLKWDETIPAQVGSILGIQSANIAVSGFATDQAYLRLQAELPRFAHPVAVVSLFTPDVFDRNLDDDRPHLGPGLVWLPPVHRWRLMRIAKFLVPYRSVDEIDQGIIVAREVLRATIQLAQAHGANALIVVPQFAPEDSNEHRLRERILDEAGIPYVWVALNPSWRVSEDDHPDARGARTIAAAIVDELRRDEVNLTTKGIPVGFLEAAEQPERLIGAGAYGGIGSFEECSKFMSDVCYLRELAYHVDAQDEPIFIRP